MAVVNFAGFLFFMFWFRQSRSGIRIQLSSRPSSPPGETHLTFRMMATLESSQNEVNNIYHVIIGLFLHTSQLCDSECFKTVKTAFVPILRRDEPQTTSFLSEGCYQTFRSGEELFLG